MCIRDRLNDLASPTLMKLGFLKALKQLCSKFPTSLEVTLNFESESMRFDKRTEIQLFRSCKEIIANILKHANATQLNINVSFENDTLTVLISYNGQGIGCLLYTSFITYYSVTNFSGFKISKFTFNVNVSSNNYFFV